MMLPIQVGAGFKMCEKGRAVVRAAKGDQGEEEMLKLQLVNEWRLLSSKCRELSGSAR